jgi:hypothetical protein
MVTHSHFLICTREYPGIDIIANIREAIPVLVKIMLEWEGRQPAPSELSSPPGP